MAAHRDRLFASVVAGLLLGVSLTPAMAAGDETRPPPGARTLSAFELLKLYGGRSWKWDAGAGFFDNGPNRQFAAYSVENNAITTANGRWLLTDDGKLCFSAKWENASGSYPAVTCFQHAESDGQIFQRKLPDGRWYVFRHATPASGDEVNKLVPGNIVTGGLAQAMQQAKPVAMAR